MLSSQRTDSIWESSQKPRDNALYTALLLQLATLPPARHRQNVALQRFAALPY
jgi:hypothetical protein